MAIHRKPCRRAKVSVEHFLSEPLVAEAHASIARSRVSLDGFHRRLADLEDRQREWDERAGRHADRFVPPVYPYPAPATGGTLAMRDVYNWGRERFSGLFVTQRPHPNPHSCWICNSKLSLEECKSDEHGFSVHERCYVGRLLFKAA